MARAYHVLDVFTERALAGNPLRVVLDARSLDTPAMQAIAAEFNLSETVFVLPPDEPGHRARLRIFTPGRELPFAGHPSVGTAICLALIDRSGQAGEDAFLLEEQVGIRLDRCASHGNRGHDSQARSPPTDRRRL